MAVDKIEETIKEIFAKHGIAVSREDPILILLTINERLMKDSASTQKEILAHFKEELEAISYRWEEDAKNKAERILNAALTASKEAMGKGMEDGAQAAAKAMRCEVEETVAQLAIPLRESRRIAFINLIAASMVVGAVGLALWASM